MRFNIIYVLSLVMAFTLTSCIDDEPLSGPGCGVDDSPLQFSVRSFDEGTRSAEPSDNPEPETEDEKKIENFWLFQFKPDGTQLAAPKYYSVPDGQLNTVTANAYNELTKNTPMTIYVVTNLGSTWTASDYDTLEKVKAAAIPSPYPIRIISDASRTDKLLIPMSGQVDNVTVTDKSLIVVPVTRMYAKVKIQANFHVENMSVYDVTVYNMPWYCRVAPVGGVDANGEPAAVPLPENTYLLNRSFSSTDAINDWITLYVPENIRGEVTGADKTTSTNIPENALNIDIRAKYDGMDFDFTVYPGENATNNFNVRRNCVYRVTVDVLNATDQHKPSSNCYVVKPNSKVTFEPYNRIETGGDYSISDYLNPEDEDLRIHTTEIIWQTKDCIGDNTDGSRVTFTLDEENPIHSKLTVLTGAEGNALVGAKNSKGEIIWSWHIWVTQNEPDNFRDAIVFKTYAWDGSGIHNSAPRIPGYGVMPCNLGALAYTPASYGRADFATYGMMYQWGRKDPFPPFTRTTGTLYTDGWLDYTNQNAGTHYGNNNSTVVQKTSGTTESYLFHTILKSDISGKNKVRYGIANPTVYIAATKTLDNPNDYWLAGIDRLNPAFADYTDNGNWCPDEKDQGDELWGGLLVDGSMKSLHIQDDAYLFDNYGSEKSIFDPCPTGWRVAPPDLWLGFTISGRNPENFGRYPMEQVNYDANRSSQYGLSMYMRDWRSGPTSYFPTQGTLGVNGRGYHVGVCGNYHNATCSNERVNILHIHDDSEYRSYYGQHFHIFELEYKNYYVKSTAGPVRCVRETR